MIKRINAASSRNLSIQSLGGWLSNFFIIEQTKYFYPTAQKTVIFLAGQVPGLAALQAWE